MRVVHTNASRKQSTCVMVVYGRLWYKSVLCILLAND